ncbi:MAG: (deoxy)nucleoside triphosphate pyrophosphohydrolase [Weeksellaceae bacterium]
MIDVSCAIILNQNKVLIAQRNKNGKLPLKWEFPGGKVEKFETIKKSLIREIKEELNIEIEIIERLSPVEHHYSDFSIRLHPFLCNFKSGNLMVKEHEEIQWAEKSDLLNFDWAEADLPIVNEFLNFL